MAYAIIEYNTEGLPKCEICGKFFNRILSHVRQKHFINEKEYKKQFGYDLKKGICSKESSAKSREQVLINFDKCVGQNLISKGSNSRFVKGDKGRIKDQVSPQTNLRLKQRLIEDVDMIKAMKLNGEKVGKSGLGNEKRWNK
jgi:hypothetical protein